MVSTQNNTLGDCSGEISLNVSGCYIFLELFVPISIRKETINETLTHNWLEKNFFSSPQIFTRCLGVDLFPTFGGEFKNDKIPNSFVLLCDLLQGLLYTGRLTILYVLWEAN